MASGFFALLDDIAVLMDDVAAMTKVATKKTVGILADDLAVNADKASGFVSSRELPILWKITKGSLLNKLIILPIAFLLSAFLPVAIVPILIIGGIYLAYEGAEKIHEYFFHRKDAKANAELKELTPAEMLVFEKKKIKSAIMVDFILSIEIIILALGAVMESRLTVQIGAVTAIAIIATIGVYGVVALIVRMDDLGFKLIASSKGEKGFRNSLGHGMVKTLPYVIRSLTVIGTCAMILVGGGIFVHNIQFVNVLVHSLPTLLGEFLVGLIVGIAALLVFKLVVMIFGKKG